MSVFTYVIADEPRTYLKYCAKDSSEVPRAEDFDARLGKKCEDEGAYLHT